LMGDVFRVSEGSGNDSETDHMIYEADDWGKKKPHT